MTIGRAPLRRSTGGPTRSVLLAAAVVPAAPGAASARAEAVPAGGRVEALLRASPHGMTPERQERGTLMGQGGGRRISDAGQRHFVGRSGDG